MILLLLDSSPALAIDLNLSMLHTVTGATRAPVVILVRVACASDALVHYALAFTTLYCCNSIMRASVITVTKYFVDAYSSLLADCCWLKGMYHTGPPHVLANRHS